MVIQMALKQGGLTNVQGSVLDFGMNELENFKGAEAVDSKSFTISGSKILYLIKLLSPPHKDIKTGTKCRGYFRMIIKLHSMGRMHKPPNCSKKAFPLFFWKSFWL